MTHAGSCKFGNSVLEFGAVGLLVHLCGNSLLASQSPDNGKGVIRRSEALVEKR